MIAALSDSLPFYDDPDECKPCEYCHKPMYRQSYKDSKPSHFRKRRVCSKFCKERLQSGIHPGQSWGFLTILSEYGTVSNGKFKFSAAWECKCICGDITIVRTNRLKQTLRRGESASCGCRGRIAPNQKFGLLKTIRKGEPYLDSNGKRLTSWQCICDCGVQVTVRAHNLLYGHTSSCGCKTTSRLEEAVERSLNRLNVHFKREYKPQVLTERGFHYRLDFYLPDYNLNIEADGRDFHGGGYRNRSPEEQLEYDDTRNRRVSWFFGCYILRLSEDLLDGNPKHLDAKLRRFLDDMGEKPQYWLTYDFKTPC